MDVNERESIKSVCVWGIECDWGTQGLVHWKLHAALATDAHGFTRIPDDRDMLRGMMMPFSGALTKDRARRSAKLQRNAALATDARGFTRIPDDREMLRGMVCRLDSVYTLRVG